MALSVCFSHQLFWFPVTFSDKQILLRRFSMEENACVGKADQQLLPWASSKKEQLISY